MQESYENPNMMEIDVPSYYIKKMLPFKQLFKDFLDLNCIVVAIFRRVHPKVDPSPLNYDFEADSCNLTRQEQKSLKDYLSK